MKVTRVIAVAVMAASVGLGALNAQTLRNSAPPAEFPPASYQGKQYVDSRGCIYIRAGIDGNVTWVPRVSRQRKQICGYKPTLADGAGTTAKPAPQQQPTVITVAPSQQPAQQPAPATKPTSKPVQTTTARPAPKPAPKPVPQTAAVATVAAPPPATRPTTRTTTARPPTVTYRRPTSASAPTSTAATTPVVAPRPGSAGQVVCPNASTFSQQYINRTGVRCGPQAEPPITYGQSSQNSAATGAAAYPVTTRVVPRHVYDNRQNTRNVAVPSGYRPVWTDDRLNPYRAERTLAASAVSNTVRVPGGYQMVERDDDRMNPNRGVLTASGDAQTDAIWSRTVPRVLLQVPTDRPVLQVDQTIYRSTAEARPPLHLRLSTRSVAGAPPPAAVTARPATPPEPQR